MKQNALPKFARDQMAREQRATAGVHPDADLLTAFCEGALPDVERAQVMDHIAHCGDCREVVFLVAPDALSQPAAEPVRATAPAAPAWWKRLMPAMASAIAIIVVGSAVLLHEDQSAEKKQVHESAPIATPEPSPSGGLTAPAEPTAPKPAPAARAKSAAPEKETTQPVPSAKDGQAQSSAMNRAVASGAHGALAAKGSSQSYQNLPVTPAPPPPPASAVRVAPGPHGALEAKGNAYSVQNAAPPVQVYVENAVPPIQTSSPAAAPAAAPASAQLAKKSEMADKAKQSSSSNQPTVTAEMSTAEMNKVQPRSTDSYSDNLAFGRQDAVGGPSTNNRSHWRIDEDGELQTSPDNKAWKPALADARARFRVVSVVGNNIWAGGSSGMLYHSLDGGQHWTRVRIATDGTPLSEAITSIKFRDPHNGSFITESGAVWETSDGGAHWKKK